MTDEVHIEIYEGYMADDQIVDEPTMAIVIYILYLLGYVTAISALAGVIIAHILITDLQSGP